MPDYLTPDEDEHQEIEQIPPSALAILNSSEHAAMVHTANLASNRRKLADFDAKLMLYANHSQPVALLMFYSLLRAGKQIIGPSSRFAEVVAPCWRNCAVASRGVGDTQNLVTAQGVFIDYEANLRNSIEVPRRITDKEGRRYSDDMVVTTLNAAMSIARRNAVLKGGVPQALWQPAYAAAQLTAVGKADSHAQRVANAMEYLNKLGVTEWQILNAVSVSSTKDLETEHLLTLRVLCEEIKAKEKTIEEVFGSVYDKEIDSLFAQLKMNMAQQQMLRGSYLGRAEYLAAYLRDRVGKGQTLGTPLPSSAQATQAAPPSVEPVALATEQVTVLPPEPPRDQAVSELGDVDGLLAAQQASQEKQAEPAQAVAGAKPRTQTSMEPPPKRRPARQTTEETAQRKPDQGKTESSQAQEQNERDQTDFAF